ncbi:hypothetical protein AgCh_028210 [Apium graveolens]
MGVSAESKEKRGDEKKKRELFKSNLNLKLKGIVPNSDVDSDIPQKSSSDKDDSDDDNPDDAALKAGIEASKLSTFGSSSGHATILHPHRAYEWNHSWRLPSKKISMESAQTLPDHAVELVSNSDMKASIKSTTVLVKRLHSSVSALKQDNVTLREEIAVLSVTIKADMPFPLTQRFRYMLQNGIDLSTLDVSYVSSRSWYFLNLFGLRGLFSLILGEENDDTQRMMEMSGFGFDPSKVESGERNKVSHVGYYARNQADQHRKFDAKSDEDVVFDDKEIEGLKDEGFHESLKFDNVEIYCDDSDDESVRTHNIIEGV